MRGVFTWRMARLMAANPMSALSMYPYLSWKVDMSFSYNSGMSSYRNTFNLAYTAIL
jgi:hypothetical protein